MPNRKSQFILSASCIGALVFTGATYEFWSDPTTRAPFAAIVVALVLFLTSTILLILSYRYRGTKLGVLFLWSLTCYAIVFTVGAILATSKISDLEMELAAKKTELQMKMLNGHQRR